MFYFILGMVFILTVQPLLDSLTALILSFFEMIKSYIGVVIHNNNEKMEDYQEQTYAIGFQYTPEEEEEEEFDV